MAAVLPLLALLLLLLAGVHHATAASYRPVSCAGTQKVINQTVLGNYYALFDGVADAPNRTVRAALEFDALAMLASARYGGVDIAEFLVTARALAATIAPVNVGVSAVVAAWENAWSALGMKVLQQGDAMARAGDVYGANAAYGRAASYLQLSERFSEHTSPSALAVFNLSMSLFTQAVEGGLGGIVCKSVAIPYTPGVALPGLWCPGGPNATKTAVTVNGFDGSMLNMFYEAAAPAVARGWNVLVMDGPGQGSASRFQHLLFRPDWEVVVSAALKWLYGAHPETDPSRVVLWGRSFGGYFAPAAFVRLPPSALHALIADGGINDMFQNVLCGLPASLQGLLATSPAEFDAVLAPVLQGNLGILSNFRWGLLGFNVSTISQFFLAFQPYALLGELGGVAGRPVFVNNPAFDTATNNQSAIFWAAMVNATTLSPSSIMLTQDATQGTGLHCDVGSTANTIGAILAWAEATLPA